MADTVLDELRSLGAKLDGLQAAQDEDAEAGRRDEEEAARHDAEAKRHSEDARRARDEADEEDARRHEEDAAAARTRAFQARMKASQWHAAMAARRREEGAEEDAKRHDEDAARLSAAAEAAKREDEESRRRDEDARQQDARRRADEEAATKDDDDDDQEAAFGRMFALFMRAAQEEAAEDDTRGDQSAAGNPLKRKAKLFDEAAMGRMMAAAMKAMTFPPGVTMGRKKVRAAHDDEEQDKALIQRMLRQKKGDMAAGNSVVDVVTRRKLRSLEASIELLTDNVKKLTTLLTDGTQPRTGLITDSGSRGPNGGSAPARRSMQATGGSREQWVDKYAGRRDDNAGKKTTAEYTKELIAQGIIEPREQMTRILELQAAGQLAD